MAADATQILQQQLSNPSRNSEGSLSIDIIAGIALALWSARNALEPFPITTPGTGMPLTAFL
jgi:hypothetical protein